VDFVNVSGYPAISFESMDQNGNLFHVIAVRQSFRMTAKGLLRLKEQPPLRERDTYFDDDPSRGIYQESDLVPFKPLCDVIVNAVAYPPHNAEDRFKVRLRVLRNAGTDPNTASLNPKTETVHPKQSPAGDAIIDKTLVVTGERFFQLAPALVRSFSKLSIIASLGALEGNDWRLTSPGNCTSLPLRYTVAFGGAARIDVDEAYRADMARRIGLSNCLAADASHSHSETRQSGTQTLLAYSAYGYNPLGTGYTTTWYLKGTDCRSIPAPRVEYPGAPITEKSFKDVLNGKTGPVPAGFAAIGRTWLPRHVLAGASAQSVDRVDGNNPQLPADFDHRYWNAAPVDQQCPYLAGDEVFILENLCSREHPAAQPGTGAATLLRFALPGERPFLMLKDLEARAAVRMCHLDTVYIDPEKATVELVWRAAIHLARNLQGAVLMLATTDEDQQALKDLLQIQGN
jgi:hypothetical protein